MKRLALAACALTVLFWLFFNVTKHVSGLEAVGVFIEDPFDAVGSFGVQLSTMAALLSLVRAFRPRRGQAIDPEGQALIFHGWAVCLASIAVTLGADLAALLRYLPRWTGTPAGWVLAALVLALLLLTALLGLWALRLGRALMPFPAPASAWRTGLYTLATGLCLFFYPDGWRSGIGGAILTALAGMAVLLLVTWAWMCLFFPAPPGLSEDVLDDLMAIYAWLRSHAQAAGALFRWLEAVASAPRMRAIGRWLNPRRHHWRLLVLAALGMGLLLVGMEMAGEGLPDRSVVLMVLSVFIGLEGSGVLLGYALFNRYLGIFK